jgi:hypothetical protein
MASSRQVTFFPASWCSWIAAVWDGAASARPMLPFSSSSRGHAVNSSAHSRALLATSPDIPFQEVLWRQDSEHTAIFRTAYMPVTNTNTSTDPSIDRTRRNIARICYEAFRAYDEALGDSTQSHWDALDEITQAGMIGHVCTVLGSPRLTAEQRHERWRSSCVSRGWKVGPVLDYEAKTDPRLVPWAQLPERHRVQECLWQAVVRTCAAAGESLND